MFLKLTKSKKEKGFTLVEVLVAVSIIGVLSSVAFVSFSSAREKSRINAAKMHEANHVGALRNYLVAEWKFDDPTNRYLDSSGNEHNGFCSSPNCPTTATGEGVNGKDALQFDGVNDIVNLGIGSDYFPLKTLTVCSWVKTPGLGSGMGLNGIIGVTYGFSLTLTPQGSFSTRMDDGVNTIWATDDKSLNDNKFHHVCLNYNGINRNMYVDGILSLSVPTVWTGTTRWPDSTVELGRDVNNYTYYFNGLIDDIRIYSSYLTASEIQKLYAEESSQRKLVEAN